MWQNQTRRLSCLRQPSTQTHWRVKRQTRNVVLGATCFVLFVLSGFLPAALAAQGDLDLSFGSNGKVLTDFGGSDDYGFAVALQPDGCVVVAGRALSNPQSNPHSSLALARHNPDGSLDLSFGDNGRVTAYFNGGYNDTISGLAIQPDGKIVAVGSVVGNSGAGVDIALLRYNADGSPDNSFGTGGRLTTDFNGTDDTGYGVALQRDGKIVVTGLTNGYYLSKIALVRYNPDGSLDSTFGNGGKVTTHYAGGYNTYVRTFDVAIQPDGHIVTVGYYYADMGTNGNDFALTRYNSDGSLDSTFGTGGEVTTNFGSDDDAFGLALQPDGKIIAAGFTKVGYRNNDFAVARYNADGSLDTSFGNNGKVTTAFTSSSDELARAVALQKDGKIVVVGHTGNYPIFDFALVRYTPNGQLDPGFGSNGKISTDFFGNWEEAEGLAVRPDGKIVVVGECQSPSGLDLAVARYLAKSGSTASDFNGDGQSDPAVFQSDGTWQKLNVTNNSTTSRQWGLSTDNIVPGDYDGDGTTDLAVFRESEGNWYILNSSTGAASLQNWGTSGDRPVPGDYDGDGKADVAVFRGSEGNWYIRNSSTGAVRLQGWGAATDKLVPGDYDADGKTDVAVFRPSEGNWYIINSATNTVRLRNWGAGNDQPVAGDYDGDGKTDLAVFRPAEGNWYIINSATNSATVRSWGASDDRPVPGDYDGDGRTDMAVFRPAENTWYLIRSSSNTASACFLGNRGDVPVAWAYVSQ